MDNIGTDPFRAVNNTYSWEIHFYTNGTIHINKYPFGNRRWL